MTTQLETGAAARVRTFQAIVTALETLDLTETTITAHPAGTWSIHTRIGEQTARLLLDILAGVVLFDEATGPAGGATAVDVTDYPDTYSRFTSYRSGPYTIYGELRPTRETATQ